MQKLKKLRNFAHGYRFVPGCQVVRYSNGGLKTGLKKPVYGPKCPVFKWAIK